MKKTKKFIQIKAKDLPKLRKKLLKKQKGRCAVCGDKPKRPCVDHHHKKRIKGTGLIRAVLCSNCNVFLAKAENNCVRYGISRKQLPKRLKQIAKYLKQPQTNMIHPSEAPKPKKLMKSSYNKLKKIHNPLSVIKGKKVKFPDFPKSGKMIIALEKLYKHYKIKPEFYK